MPLIFITRFVALELVIMFFVILCFDINWVEVVMIIKEQINLSLLGYLAGVVNVLLCP